MSVEETPKSIAPGNGQEQVQVNLGDFNDLDLECIDGTGRLSLASLLDELVPMLNRNQTEEPKENL